MGREEMECERGLPGIFRTAVWHNGVRERQYLKKEMKSMYRGRTSITVLILLTVVACVMGSPNVAGAATPTTIRLAYVAGPGSLHQLAADMFAKLVREKTNNEVDIKVYSSGLFGSEKEAGQGIANGTLDAVIVSSAAFVGYEPRLAVFEIPFIFRDGEHARKVVLGELGQELLHLLETNVGCKPLTWLDYAWESGGRQFTNSVRPIRTPEDMKGLRIRNPEIPMYQAAIRALGAVPVAISFDELYMALDRRVVDGQHNQILHIYSQRFYEVQKYMTIINFARTPHILVFSKAAWNRLTPSQQAILLDAAQITAKKVPELCAENDKRMLQEIESKVQVLRLSPEEVAAFRELVIRDAYPRLRDQYGEFMDRIQAVK